jgi:hypothetical protein
MVGLNLTLKIGNLVLCGNREDFEKDLKGRNSRGQ